MPRAMVQKIEKPIMPGALCDATNFSLSDEITIEAQRIFEKIASGVAAARIKIDGCQIKNSTFSTSQLEQAAIMDTVIENTDLANVCIKKGFLNRVEFVKCRMTGFRMIEGNIKSVVFRDCQLKLAQFRGLKMKNVVFENYEMTEADFGQSDAPGVWFSKCDLMKADFSGANLFGADFRSSSIAGINIGISSLKGVLIEPSQLPGLAWLLGVKLSE